MVLSLSDSASRNLFCWSKRNESAPWPASQVRPTPELWNNKIGLGTGDKTSAMHLACEKRKVGRKGLRKLVVSLGNFSSERL